MPGGDRTGPAGAGPMTGRGAGFCAGDNQPGYVTGGGFGRGRGRGQGCGFRRCRRIPGGWVPDFRNTAGIPEEAALKGELAHLKEQMNRIEKQIEQIRDRS